MTAPWADQPTPLVGKLTIRVPLLWKTLDAVESADARAIEQRMRAGEALLADYINTRPLATIDHAKWYCGWLDKIEAHLAAAREMDQTNASGQTPAAKTGKDG